MTFHVKNVYNIEEVSNLIRSNSQSRNRALAESVGIGEECVWYFFLKNSFHQYNKHFFIKRFLSNYDIPVLDHPLYSPDLAPREFASIKALKVKAALILGIEEGWILGVIINKYG